MKHFSQYQQDRLIDFFFNAKNNGVFLDIGAHDGISFSNTYFLEKERHWKGICIEPIPSVFEKLKENRNCIVENCCISDVNGNVTFREVTGPDMLSGIVDFFDETHLIRIENEIKMFPDGGYKDISVNSYNINDLLEKYNCYSIDYCSIDTEGVEYQIVKSIDFERFKIKAFSIENNNKDNTIRLYLKANGYICIPSIIDDFFFLKGSDRIFQTMLRIVSFRLKFKIKDKIKKFGFNHAS
jgi:FkbM family methyltransferase